MQAKWKVILNPNAGIKKAERDWPEISDLLNKHGFEFSMAKSEYVGHAIRLSRDAVLEGYRKFIVVGGDGTLNETVNGIFKQSECKTTDITLGMVMVGTGNDWGKTFNISSDYEDAVKTIINHQVFTQDVGFVSYFKGRMPKKRYFVNIAGLGFDARVVEKVNMAKEKGRGGGLLYYKNLVGNLLSYKSKPFSMNIDGQKVEDELFSIGIGVCRYNGNGMMQLPEAIPNDGFLEVTLIKKIGKLDVVKSLGKLYDGSLLNHPKVEGFRGQAIEFSSAENVHLEADGETLGMSPCKFGIVPQSLNVIVNKTY